MANEHIFRVQFRIQSGKCAAKLHISKTSACRDTQPAAEGS